MAQVLVALFLALHGAVHLAYLAPNPPVTADGPTWPFGLERSGLLDRIGWSASLGRRLGRVLAVLSFGAFSLAALSTIGWIPEPWWSTLVAVGAIASLALLLIFYHPWLVVGIVIDVALLIVAGRPGR